MLRHVCASLFAAATISPAPPAAAAEFPTKPIRFLVPFAPGGGTDLLARAMQDKLERVLGVAIIVENRPGAGGTVGGALVARAAPDGYTYMVSSASYTFIPALHKNLPYDPVNDFRHLSMLTTQALILGVHPSMPVKTTRELVALAQKRPQDIFYGSGGSGSNLHLTTELFKHVAKINLVHVPYKGGGPVIVALLTGEIQVGFMGILGSRPFRQSGQIRGIAVSTKQRSPAVPELPTIDESGVPGYDKASWTGFLTQAKVPEPIITRMHQALTKVLKDPDAVKAFADDGLIAVASTPDQFKAFVHAEVAEWAKLVRQIKL